MLKALLDSAARREANPGAILNVTLVYLGCFSWQKLDGHLENWHDRKHRKGYNCSSIKATKSFLTWLLSSFVLKRRGGTKKKSWLLCSLSYRFICNTGNNPRRHGSRAFVFSKTSYPLKTSRLLLCLSSCLPCSFFPLQNGQVFISQLSLRGGHFSLVFLSLFPAFPSI